MARPRFKATESTTTQHLLCTMRKMEASNLKVNKNLMQGDVEIIFDRNGRRYIFKCNTYDSSLDNFRAAQLCIDYLYRALESYGVTQDQGNLFDKVFDNFFLGFQATPDDTNLMLGYGDSWHQILNIEPTASKADIMNAYRALAKVHHPDAGGTKESFLKLRKAYEEGLEQCQKS